MHSKFSTFYCVAVFIGVVFHLKYLQNNRMIQEAKMISELNEETQKEYPPLLTDGLLVVTGTFPPRATCFAHDSCLLLLRHNA